MPYGQPDVLGFTNVLGSLFQQKKALEIRALEQALRERAVNEDILGEQQKREQSAQLFPVQLGVHQTGLDEAKRQAAFNTAMDPAQRAAQYPAILGQAAEALPAFRETIGKMYNLPTSAPQWKGSPFPMPPERAQVNELNTLGGMIASQNRPGGREGSVAGAQATAKLPAELELMKNQLAAALEQIKAQGVESRLLAQTPHYQPQPSEGDIQRYDREVAQKRVDTLFTSQVPKIQQEMDIAIQSKDLGAIGKVASRVADEIEAVNLMKKTAKSKQPYDEVSAILQQLFDRLKTASERTRPISIPTLPFGEVAPSP